MWCSWVLLLHLLLLLLLMLLLWLLLWLLLLCLMLLLRDVLFRHGVYARLTLFILMILRIYVRLVSIVIVVNCRI